MDVWERTVRRLIVVRSNNAVDILNFFEANRNGEEWERMVREQEEADIRIRLAIILLKLNSGSTKASEWASPHPRPTRRVSQ